ncbi:MAG: hypothetical protein MN733_43585 [Nitrososphaera sp.]|nr:hypothetical protein [Nitrososphaera sp.]
MSKSGDTFRDAVRFAMLQAGNSPEAVERYERGMLEQYRQNRQKVVKELPDTEISRLYSEGSDDNDFDAEVKREFYARPSLNRTLGVE